MQGAQRRNTRYGGQVQHDRKGEELSARAAQQQVLGQQAKAEGEQQGEGEHDVLVRGHASTLTAASAGCQQSLQ